MNRLEAVERLLASLPGIVGVRRPERAVLEAVGTEEERYERSAFLPLRNEGVREVLKREAAVALLKDGLFRPPPAPTVYLVEAAGAEAAGAEAAGPCIETGGVRYRVLGEEILAGREPAPEKTLFLAESFVLYPERRASPRTPSFFLTPPLGFPELEEKQAELGVRRVVSISPSSQADVILREACGFPADAKLATLLLGFDWADPPPIVHP